MNKKINNKKEVIKLNKLEKILLITSISLFIMLASLVITNNIKCFDNFVFSIVSKLRCNYMTFFFKIITFCCSLEFIFVSTILMLFFSKKNGKSFTLNMIICVFINQLLKNIFVRSRPINIQLITESGYSFPSGHSMASVAFYGFFIYLILNSNLARWKKILFNSLLVLLILLIGLSRIYLGVHYASDVLAGFSLSVAYLIIFIFISRKKQLVFS